MAKFVFQYEALLRHRRHLERQRQREMAELIFRRNTMQQELREKQDTIREAKHAMRTGLVGRVDLDAISRFTHYAGQTAVAGQRAVVELAKLEGRIDAARLALLEATKARKALDRLREKQESAWAREQSRREARELDEIATQRFNHARMSRREAGHAVGMGVER